MARGYRISAKFWTLLESSGRSLTALCRQLEQLTEAQLRRFRQDYNEAKCWVNPHDWAECSTYLQRSCSEDHGDDFAAWVVMQGRAFFDEVRSHPEAIENYLDEYEKAHAARSSSAMWWNTEVDKPEYRGWQRADYIATRICQLRFGDE